MKIKKSHALRFISVVLSILMIASVFTMLSVSAKSITRVYAIFDADALPMDGGHPAFNPSIQGSGYYFDTIKWIDVESGAEMDVNSTFEAGKEYKFSAYANASDGNSFAYSNVQTMVMFGKGVNAFDFDADWNSVDGQDPSYVKELSVTITAGDPILPTVYVGGVADMYGKINEGETPSSYSPYAAQKEGGNDDRFYVYSTKWYDVTTSPFTTITEDTPFEGDHQYAVEAILAANGPYKFKTTGSGSIDANVKFNVGDSHYTATLTTAGTSDPSKFLSASYTLPTVAPGKKKVDTLNITKIKVPAAGTAWDMSDIDCTYNSNGGGFELDTSRGRMPGGEGTMGVLTGKGISSIYDSNDSFYTDPLVEGEKYSISIFFKAAPGFEFPAAAEDINIKFDGKTLHPDMIITSGEVFRFTYEFTATKSEDVIYTASLTSTLEPKSGDAKNLYYNADKLATFYTTTNTDFTIGNEWDESVLYLKDGGTLTPVKDIEDQSIIAGNTYLAKILLKPAQGKKFAAEPAFNFTNSGLEENDAYIIAAADGSYAEAFVEYKSVPFENGTGDCTWAFDVGRDTLTISGKGAMADYDDWSKAPWAAYKDDILYVVIEDGVTNVGDNAFCGYTNLSEVTLGKDVETIGEWAFNDCSSLSSVNLPDGLTTIKDGAFYGTAVTEFDVPSTVTTIGNNGLGNDPNTTIKCEYGSAAYQYAKAAGMKTDATNMKYIVSFDTTGSGYGSYTMSDVEVEPGTKYKAPALKDTIYPAEGYLFDGWTVDGNKVAVGDEVEINKDTVFKANWAEDPNVYVSVFYRINNKVTYIMDKVVVAKGGKFTVPDFAKIECELPAGRTFDHWELDGSKVEAGDEVTLNKNADLRAVLNGAPDMKGDVNRDESVDNADAMLLKRYVAGWDGIVVDEANADIDGDGEVTNADAMILKRYVAGWSNEEVTKYFATASTD